MNNTRNHRLSQSSATIWCILKHNAVLFTIASHKIPIFRLHRRQQRRRRSGVSSKSICQCTLSELYLVLRSVLLYVYEENRNRIISFVRSFSFARSFVCESVCRTSLSVALAMRQNSWFVYFVQRIQSQCGHAHRELGKSKTVILSRRTV